MAAPEANTKDSQVLAEYVIKNIDVALENGWVKVYYQPVVRTLTGQLCGAESLARWIDPTLGFLAPDKFIGALEASRQIHKLDIFIIRQVCKDIADRIKNGLNAVPVSVNLSRLDFESADMLKVVEEAVNEYDLPRDYIHVEITESMIVSDAALMTRVIDSFRNKGYEVWMDDFGSGYSSLTLLKDYQFDTLKLDMEFLRSFNERSKAIMTSTVTMAKDIGIKTLAEGVETEEQIEFLKSIGCGRLQGYFYGKPMPVDEFFVHIEQEGVMIEPRQWRHFYDVASFNARWTDEPLEILEDDGKEFKTLFMNTPYKRQVFDKDHSLEDYDRLVYHTNSPLIKKYREFANTIETTKKLETFYYTNSGNILCFQGQEIGENAGRHLIRGSIRNLSSDMSLSKRNSLDFRLKELNHLFEVVAQMNPDTNTVSPLLGKFMYVNETEADDKDLLHRISVFTNEYVAPGDAARLKEFMNPSTLGKRLKNNPKGFMTDIFRIKQRDGNYQWKELSIMLIPGTGGKEYLFCIKSTADDAYRLRTEKLGAFKPEDYGIMESGESLYSKMWENVIGNSSIKFFWKDKDRRFLGASRAFLDFYGLPDVESLLGKNDEDMGWHVDGKAYMEDELKILHEGKKVYDVPGQAIVDGVVHNIICNKGPIYEDGQIVGLMGYFEDVDDSLSRVDKLYNAKKLDPITGIMNVKSLMEAMIDYAHKYHEQGISYSLIVLRNETHNRIEKDYGEKFANKVLQKMADEIISVAGKTCASARTLNADFALLTHISDPDQLEDIVNQIKSRIEGMRDLEGKSITMRLKTAWRTRTDDDTTDENMYQIVLANLK